MKNEKGRKADFGLNSLLQDEIRHQGEAACALARILEGSPIPTFVIDVHGKIIYWNHACETLTAIPATEIIGTHKHRDVFYAERRPLMADLVVKNSGPAELAMLYGGKFQASRLITDGYEAEDFFPKLGKNGKWLFFTAAPIKDDAGNILGAIETLQDVTDKRLAEHEIRASEARYRQLFESANDAIFILKNGVIVDCNQKALNLFNISKRKIIGLTALEFSPVIQPNGEASKDGIAQKMAMTFQDVPQVFDWQLLDGDGKPFDVEVSLTSFKIGDNPHGIAIIRDITERNKMLQILQRRKKELNEKTNYLERVNQALKASLDHREVEKRAVEENILINLKRFVFPYLEELEQCTISVEAKAYINIINTNLNDLISPFSKTVFAEYLEFTPTEIRIADFIRDGKNTKEIAHLLGLSPSSVQWHRKNIREKLKITNKKVNLHTYLNSLAQK